MAFIKHGSPEAIKDVVSGEEEFEKLRKKIAAENNLIRCSRCAHLLAKSDKDGNIDLQHRKLILTIKSSNLQGVVKCPYCNQLNVIRSE